MPTFLMSDTCMLIVIVASGAYKMRVTGTSFGRFAASFRYHNGITGSRVFIRQSAILINKGG